MTEELFEKVYYDDSFINSNYHMATFWFIGPVELLEGKYEDADACAIQIEVPIYAFNADHADVMISPTKDGEDFDWCPYELDEEWVEQLLSVAKASEPSWQV